MAPTISVNPQKPGVALSGISGYEYILQSTSAVPADDASITDSVTTDSPSIIVHEEGINYIFFRTVSRNGNRSEWSGPQLIKLDTHPIKLTVQDIKGYAATSTYSTLRYSFYLDDIKLGDVITYEFNVSGVEDNDVLSDFNDRGLNSNILCSDNQCTIQGEIVTTSYDFSIRDKTDYSKYRFFDIVASQTLPVNNISYDVVVHRFTES